MRLTEKKAIGYAIELWTELAETGGEFKHRCSFWDTHEDMIAHCPLCEYGSRKAPRAGVAACDYCPYFKVFGYCCDKDSPYARWGYGRWWYIKTKRTRKKYASLFLEQLKQLR